MTGKSRISKVTGKVVTDYVDKKKFTEDIHQYVIKQKQRVLDGLPREKMPDSIGLSIIKIVEGIGKRSNFRNYCVDQETEALTKRGWLKYNQINESDIILSMDVSDNTYKWSKIHEIFRNENYDGKMYKLTGSTIDALVTPEHKFVTENGLEKIDNITCKKHLITMANPLIDYGDEFVNDNVIKIIGWYITEGSRYTYTRKNGEVSNYKSIHQSQKVNPHYCDEIREILLSFVTESERNVFTEHVNGDGMLRFNISNKCTLSSLIDKLVNPNGKVPTLEFLHSLSQRQRLILIETMMKGDGWLSQYVQKDKKHIDFFVMLCTLSGVTTNTSHRTTQTKYGLTSVYTVTLSNKKSSYMERVNMYGGKRTRADVCNKPTVHYKGVVWCPRTDYGTFVCRRGKKVYVTGNTYIDEMIGDAIVSCVAAVHKFDPEKSDNAFGFMSFCAWNVFLNRIQLEKKIQTGKESLMLDNTYLTSELGEYADEFDINREDSINMYWSGK